MSFQEVKDPYEISILTWALQSGGSNKRNDAYDILNKIKRTDATEVYWAAKRIPPNKVNFVDTLPYYQPRELYDNEG